MNVWNVCNCTEHALNIRSEGQTVPLQRLQSSHLKENHIPLTAFRMLRRYFRREFSSRNSFSCEEVKFSCCGSLSLSISSWSNLISLSYMAYWKHRKSQEGKGQRSQPSDTTYLSYKKYFKVQAYCATNIVNYASQFSFSFTLTGNVVTFP